MLFQTIHSIAAWQCPCKHINGLEMPGTGLPTFKKYKDDQMLNLLKQWVALGVDEITGEDYAMNAYNFADQELLWEDDQIKRIYVL